MVQSIIQKEVGGKWSRTQKCWYVPFSESNYLLLTKSLFGKAVLETGELKKNFIVKKEAKVVGGLEVEKKINPATGSVQKPLTANYIQDISKENKQALEQFKRQLILKSYSPSTIRTYENEFRQFLSTIKEFPAKDLTTSRLKDYFQYCHTYFKVI